MCLCVESTYPEAACNPNPRDPPVTTATFPSREKMLEKLDNWTCSVADMIADDEEESSDMGKRPVDMMCWGWGHWSLSSSPNDRGSLLSRTPQLWIFETRLIRNG